MANLKALSFVAFLVAAFIVVHCEKDPCRLVISRYGRLRTAIMWSNKRYFCKLASECFTVKHRVIGPLWKFKGKWVGRRLLSELYNGTARLTIQRIRDEDYGTYECVARFNKRRLRATVTLRETPIRGDVVLPDDILKPTTISPAWPMIK